MPQLSSFSNLHWDSSRYPKALVRRKVAKALCAQYGIRLPAIGYIVDVASESSPQGRKVTYSLENRSDEFVVWKFF